MDKSLKNILGVLVIIILLGYIGLKAVGIGLGAKVLHDVKESVIEHNEQLENEAKDKPVSKTKDKEINIDKKNSSNFNTTNNKVEETKDDVNSSVKEMELDYKNADIELNATWDLLKSEGFVTKDLIADQQQWIKYKDSLGLLDKINQTRERTTYLNYIRQ